MARIRSIKPELLEDEKTASLNHLEWRVFVSLLLLADDYGNFRATPGRVAGVALWAHGDDVGPVLDRLDAVDLIRLYVVDGQRYGHVRGWSKHQKVDHPGKPSCPAPPPSRDPREDSRDPRETVAPDLIGSDLKGLDGNSSVAAPARDPGTTEPMPEFRLWPSGRWLYWFSEAWAAKYGNTYLGGQSVTKACGTLDGNLAHMPEPERIEAQNLSQAMFEAFLSDPSGDAAGHPFSWFVERWGVLRLGRRSPAARGSPGRQPSTATRDNAARVLAKYGEMP